MLRGMKAFLGRSQESVRNMDRLQKLGIFHEGSEVKSKTGKMVVILVEI